MNEEFRILKISTCPSLSGRSNLTYQLASKGEDIHLRIVANSAGGLFSKEWLSLDQVKISADVPFTVSSLHNIFKGKSVNTSSFFLAILRAECLIKNNEEKSRTYLGCDPTAFHSAMEELMKAEVSLADTHMTLPSAKPVKKPKKAA